MYTTLKNVQVIISLLKQYGISNLVLSPGTRNVPLVHSVESDNFFHCFSIVDERSAAYFALGIAEITGKPACFCCTSSTAACNYMPAMQEAYERHIPLIALTADRNHVFLYQQEDQMIEQYSMYGKYSKKSVTLPIVKSDVDLWYCERITNEALLELDHGVTGPVQINFEIEEKIHIFDTKEMPQYWKISRIKKDNELRWKEYAAKLSCAKRILVICGQRYSMHDNLTQALIQFAKLTGAVISYEYMSNLNEGSFVKTLMAAEAMTDQEFITYIPDIVITLEAHFFSFIKYRLRAQKRKFVHWRVDADGNVCDPFCSLNTIFECSSTEFIDKMNSILKNSNINSDINNNRYLDLWRRKIESVRFPDLKFTNFSVIKDFVQGIPENALVHLSVLNSIRLFNFQNIDKPIRCYANIGADGIDGAVSTFLGQCEFEKLPAFLVVGDLSFIYDMNATCNVLNNNVRILLINNFAGGEFHNNFGLETFSTLNDYIAAGHSTELNTWIKGTNALYLSARNQEELHEGFKQFFAEGDSPIIMEVFTDANTDSKVLKAFYEMNRKLSVKEKMIKCLKRTAKRAIKMIGKY